MFEVIVIDNGVERVIAEISNREVAISFAKGFRDDGVVLVVEAKNADQ
jgi:hypothetical protein